MSHEKNQQIFRKTMVAGDALSQSAVRAQPVVLETGARCVATKCRELGFRTWFGRPGRPDLRCGNQKQKSKHRKRECMSTVLCV